MEKAIRVSLFIGLFATTFASLEAQSRLMGDKYTISVGNFPTSFGTTYDPVLVPHAPDFHDFDSLELDGDDWGGDPVELTFDGIEEAAGGLLVNERVVQWEGINGGIFAEQAAGIDGQTEFDLFEWERPGEVMEFSFKTADKGWLSDDVDGQSFYSLIGLDWANSFDDEFPFFYAEGGFYFYYAKDGVPVTGYETQLEDIGLLVGEHPFDESVEEVVYIGYSQNQVEEVTKPYEGGTHITGGTTQLDENDASWAALLQVMGVVPSDQNELHIGMLVDPPRGEALVFDTGDTNLDGTIDAADIDLLYTAINDNLVEARFDLNDDGSVDLTDRDVWVEQIKKTYIGDANLDGVFDSGDLVDVFQSEEYDDGIAGNSTWATGDWTGDKEFDSGDLVLAFQKEGYNMPPRMAVAAVPEPSSLALLLLAALLSLGYRRATRLS